MTGRIHSRFPIEFDLPERLDFVGMHYDEKGYRLHVMEFASTGEDIFEINFGAVSLAQRSMDEGFYLSLSWTIDKVDKPIGPIVLVTGSDFLDWFHEQSCQIYSRDQVIHVAVLTQNEWVEVLCLKIPTVRRMRRKSSCEGSSSR